MIDDERCERVMKKFRKRRRERKAIKVGSLGIEAFQNPRQRRRTDHDSDGDGDDNDNDNDFMTNPLSTSSRHRSSQQRNQRQKHVAWGENLARRRAFTNNSDNKSDSDSDSTTNNNTRTILPEIIHRKPESIHTFSCYNRCIFLDSYDKVIGVDNCGTLDVIRLADIRSSSDAEIPSSTKVRRGSLSTTTHEKIATEFEFGANIRQQQFSNVHIQALNGGSTVAFGMGNDSLYLLDLEYGEERRINCRSNGNDNNNNNNGVLTPISLSSSFFRAYRTQHPQRKYYRDRRNPSLSIYELTRHASNNDALYDSYANNNSNNNNNNGTYSNGNVNGNISELHKIDYNAGRERVPSPVRFIPGLCPPHDARWDVLEVHPGSNGMNSLLHVAHVDSDYDAFWMQILDGRTNNGTTTVLIDGSTRDRPGTGEEHITAVSMVTDICMATSHIYCGDFGLTPAGDFFDRDLPYVGHSGMSSCIKLWDIRMVKKKNSRYSNTNSSGSMSPTPVDIIAIPPSPFFRHSNIEVAEPVARVHTQLTSGKGALAFSRATFADGKVVVDDNNIVGKDSSTVGSDYIITNLSANTRDPSCGSNNNGSTRGGSLMVTAQSRTKSTRIEHCLLNLSSFQMTRKVSQTNSSLGCQPIHAVASSRNLLATCSNRSNINNPSGNNDVNAGCRSAGASTGIFIYDMNEPPTTSSMSFFGSGSSHDDTTSLMTSQYYSPHRQQREDPTWSFRMDASLTDRYGMETELSCIAMNANGTALLGGSTDGDLFVWRGI